MCGIVYAHNRKGKPVNNDVLQQFDNQRARGTQGFGLYDGSHNNMVHATEEDDILKWLVKYDSNLILFHHRWPTSTKNVKQAAHPFSTKKYFGDNQYILVHNGWIDNAKELRKKHKKQGIRYQSLLKNGTFNDSEALLWDFALAMESGRDELEAYGAIAFICIKLVKGELDKLYFARNYQKPLNLLKTKEAIGLSSEGEGEQIDVHKLHSYNYNTKRISKKFLFVPSMDGNAQSCMPYGDTSLSDHGTFEHTYKPSNPDLLDTSHTNSVDDEHVKWFKETKNRLLVTNIESANEIVNNIFMSQDEILEEMEYFVPESDAIQAKAFNYMNITDGNYHNAVQLMEDDIMYLENDAMYLNDYKEIRTIELACALLEGDPKWVNTKSVSPIWAGDKTPKKQLKLLEVVNG